MNPLEPNDDGEALEILIEHYGNSRGMIYPKNPNRPETPEETAAIDYLCTEWLWPCLTNHE